MVTTASETLTSWHNANWPHIVGCNKPTVCPSFGHSTDKHALDLRAYKFLTDGPRSLMGWSLPSPRHAGHPSVKRHDPVLVSKSDNH